MLIDGEPAPGADAPEPDASAPHTILVVDDEIGIRKGCQRVLSSEGHEVLLAETAEAGLELLRQTPDVSVTLVDLRMPGMGGLEFLSHAREMSPHTVCVVITAYATVDTAVEATKRDAFDFLTKPFTPEELLRVTNKALGRARLLRERSRLHAERDRRLLELTTEKSRLRTIIDCMADGVLVCNDEDLLVLHNPAALRVLPHLRRPGEVRKLGEAIEPAELFEMVARAREQQKRLSGEVRLPEVMGGGWIQADAAPVIDHPTRRFLGTVTVIQDITQIKQVEQVKAQFVNMVAHELRTPLAAVDSYLAVLAQGLVGDPEEQRRVVQRCRERVGALVQLVTDLLDVARMESGRVHREIAPQHLGDVLGTVKALMEPLALERGITLTVAVPDSLPLVEADREELVRLFGNLVSNAIKYNRLEGRVDVTARTDGPYVAVAVSDTGVGISEQGLERLFTEFFREKRPETELVTGTGLGLSIVKRIVDHYHGRIDAHSRLDEGSTFTVWLPYEGSPAAAANEE